MFKPDGSVNESPAKITIPILQDFTKIPNTLLDALCGIRIPGECRQVLDAIVRNTLGWNRQEAELSLNKLSELTGIKHSSVVRCIKKLESMNIISTNRSGRVSAYGINLDVTQWHRKQKKSVSHKKETSKIQEVSLKLDTETSLKNVTDASIITDTPLIKSKDKLKESIKQSEKPLAFFSDNAEKAQATAPATVPEPEPPAAAPPEPLAEVPATPVPLATVPVPSQTAKEVFQSLFDVAVPGNFHDLDAIAEMVRRKLAGKLNNVKNPLGYLNSLSGKVTSSVAPAPVQQTTSGVSFFVTETPRMDHADMAKINDIWDTMAMEERKLYEARALPKFEQQAGRYKTPLHLLAKGIFNTEQLQKHNTITTGIEM